MIGKLNRYISAGTDQFLAEMIHTGGGTLHSRVCKLNNFIMDKEEVPQWRRKSVIVPIYKKG
jgi:hypothetical protein